MSWFISIADGLRTSFLRYFLVFLYNIRWTHLKKHILYHLEEPKPSTIEETEDTDAVHRRFLKDPSAKVKDGNFLENYIYFWNYICMYDFLPF